MPREKEAAAKAEGKWLLLQAKEQEAREPPVPAYFRSQTSSRPMREGTLAFLFPIYSGLWRPTRGSTAATSSPSRKRCSPPRNY